MTRLTFYITLGYSVYRVHYTMKGILGIKTCHRSRSPFCTIHPYLFQEFDINQTIKQAVDMAEKISSSLMSQLCAIHFSFSKLFFFLKWEMDFETLLAQQLVCHIYVLKSKLSRDSNDTQLKKAYRQVFRNFFFHLLFSLLRFSPCFLFVICNVSFSDLMRCLDIHKFLKYMKKSCSNSFHSSLPWVIGGRRPTVRVSLCV
jgi:hypothetical protein